MLQRWRHARRLALIRRHAIDEPLWQGLLQQFPFLPNHPRLRELSSLFLAHKEFSTTHGLELTDEMALAVAAQASLPLLGMSLRDAARDPLTAKRSAPDAAGVMHHWQEALSGEAMDGGPLSLSWLEVSQAAEDAATGINLVVHEFAHVLDMAHGHANGVPALDADFPRSGGGAGGQSPYAHWQNTLTAAFEDLCDRWAQAERFGGVEPLIDSYATTAPEEFFAVTSEAHLVQPERLSADLPSLVPLYEALYQTPMWRR
jgi:MtfA peptidase